MLSEFLWHQRCHSSTVWYMLPILVFAGLLPPFSGSWSGKEFSCSSQACLFSMCVWKTEQTPEINRFFKSKSQRSSKVMSLTVWNSVACWLHIRITWGTLNNFDAWALPQRFWFNCLAVWPGHQIFKSSLGNSNVQPRLRSTAFETNWRFI